MLKRLICIKILAISLFGSTISVAQTQSGQTDNESFRVITTAVPFLSFAPDARGISMGDAGVATSPDANSVHWNNGKLAFIDSDAGASVNASQWLGNIVNDMWIYYLSGYYKLDDIQTIGASLRYFDLGEITETNILAQEVGVINPREAAFDITYSRKLNDNMGIGLTARYLWSNISSELGSNTDGRPGTSIAVDLGYYYIKQIGLGSKNGDLSFGAHFSNIGQKITYSNENNENFIPVNLRLGTALKTELDPFNTLTFALDFNKLLVPSPSDTASNQDQSLLSGIFGSFGDAQDGFSEELKEFTISFGAEYWYNKTFAVRAGYFHEHAEKGNRKYVALGAGVRYQSLGVDFAYLVPTIVNHPLAETLKVSLMVDFATGRKAASN